MTFLEETLEEETLKKTFKDLFSHPEILKAIEDAGYTTPTQIQQEAIPEIMKGSDLQACAQTGTGKSAAFLLPSLLKIAVPSESKVKGPRILVLVPTRELAIQVAAEANKYSKHMSMVKTVCIYGGQPFPIQNKELSRHYEILVATPGRLIDHMERGKIDFSRLEMMILDEADRMLDMGFIEDVEHIAEATPENRQTLLFSATLKPNILKLSKRLLKDPVEIRITPQVEEHRQIEQKLHFVDNITQKFALLEDILIDESINQAIVFTATKRHADELNDKLQEMGHRSDALHGDMKQGHRTRTINKMRQGKIRILVATDVAARGIDVPTITHVVNFDLPNNAEDYVHRIGRTGRAGATGLAISFVSPKDRSMVREIERFTGKKLFPDDERAKESNKDKGSREKKGFGKRGSKFGRSDSSKGSSHRFEGSRPERRPREERFEEGFRPSRKPFPKRSEEGKSFRRERFQEERPRDSFESNRSRDVNVDTSFDVKKARKESRFKEEPFQKHRGSEEGFHSKRDFHREKGSFEKKRDYGKKFQSRDSNDKPFKDKRSFLKGVNQEKGEKTGYFANREKKSSRGFIKLRDGDFQGSNIHREKAKTSAGHRGKNSTFSRKRRSSVHS